ncbi:MAG: hypothetical protein AB7O65_14605, partial [Candidatus Korobacteraceae bacterium]
MTSRLTGVVLFLVVAFVFCSQASAQSVTGLPPFSSLTGPPDRINLSNLNINIAIPILQKPGRGLPLNYVLAYNSSVWERVTVNWNDYWLPRGGWQALHDVLAGRLTYDNAQWLCSDPYDPFNPDPYRTAGFEQNFVYTTPAGTQHSFSYYTSYDECASTSGSGGTTDATDGSGYQLVPNTGIITPGGLLINPPYD